MNFREMQTKIAQLTSENNQLRGALDRLTREGPGAELQGMAEELQRTQGRAAAYTRFLIILLRQIGPQWITISEYDAFDQPPGYRLIPKKEDRLGTPMIFLTFEQVAPEPDIAVVSEVPRGIPAAPGEPQRQGDQAAHPAGPRLVRG